jgi:serine/threonine-protein kinase RsbW
VSSPARSSTVYRNLKLDGGDRTTEEVAALVREIARQAELLPRKEYWLRLAAEEITTNITQHGYQGPGPIWLAGEIAADEVRLLIEDEAPAFDPLKHDRHARLAVDPAEREAGGFGLLLAMHRLDGFTYAYVAGKNRNTLIMCRAPVNSDT